MDEALDLEFIVDSLGDERDYPIPYLTGWETIVFQLGEDDDPLPR